MTNENKRPAGVSGRRGGNGGAVSTLQYSAFPPTCQVAQATLSLGGVT